MKPCHSSRTILPTTALALFFAGAGPVVADPPKVQQLRIQKVGDTTYFHVRLQQPTDLATPNIRDENLLALGRSVPVPDPLRMPRLVPQGGAASAVYLCVPAGELEQLRLRGRMPAFPKEKLEEKTDDQGPNGPAASALEFIGKVTGKDKVAFMLLYPKQPAAKPQAKEKQERPSLAELLSQQQAWAEVPIVLDLASAKTVPAPVPGNFVRDPQRPIPNSDLEGQWATAQASYFALLEELTPEFGFYGLARDCTGRKYKIAMPGAVWLQWNARADPAALNRQLYEITTGAAAITESLALGRMRGKEVRDKAEDRTVPLAKVRGIDIAEHPWEKMLAGKKPADEPLARLVPHDNYYIHFHNIAKLLEARDLLDQWGTTLARAYEVQSKDYRLRERYEQQLCLKSTALARIFGPAVVKGVAITGNDPYVREGTDLTILFDVANPALFRAAVGPFLKEARAKFGKKLKEEQSEYRRVAIESYVTPLREVSLYRAFLGHVAVYSNSPVGIRRVIDVALGWRKPLADSLDFQYMRTIFRADDKGGDGFVFLSDPFIRNLVGPALRIKERRRLEALTSLQMVTHGALFTAWETGKLPVNHELLLQATGLKAEELFTPDGGGASWDAAHKTAVSGVYNTLHFATPLVELPMDFVSPTEAREYEEFRLQYLDLWRRYFDPIGMRLSLTKDEVRWETYILPLVKNTQYNELRRITGEKGLKFDPAVFGDKTLAQFLFRISPDVLHDNGILPLGDLMIDVGVRSWLGDWVTIRLDDSAIYAKLLESAIRQELRPEQRHDNLDEIELALQMPLTVGIEIRNPAVFAGVLAAIRKSVASALPGAVEWAPLEPPYKGTSIVRIKSQPRPPGPRLIAGPNPDRIPNFALYYALIDGAFYLSLREEPIKDLIDRSVALKEKGEKGRPQIEAAASLYLAPGSAVQAKDLLTLYLEWETHRRAQQNNRLLYVLYHSKVVSAADTSETVEAAAMTYLGYVPVSPDLAPFGYDGKYDEVSNQRHGTLRKPRLQPAADAASPAGQLLRQVRSIRADLRFREDGVHTTVTLQKQAAK